MKTYTDFEIFVHRHNGIVWECVLDEAAKAGFSRLQIWFYTQRLKWKHTASSSFRVAMRRIGRVVWWCLVVVAVSFWFQRLNRLMDTTIYKNQTEVARNVIYVCQQMPEICPSAAKVVDEVMKR